MRNWCDAFISNYMIFYLLCYHPLVQLNEGHLKLQFSSCLYLFNIGKHDHQCKYSLLKRFKNINHYAFIFSRLKQFTTNQRITAFKKFSDYKKYYVTYTSIFHYFRKVFANLIIEYTCTALTFGRSPLQKVKATSISK